jgi:hypothetical protein
MKRHCVWEKLCSKTWAQGIYSTHRTATERENLRKWARDSLATRRGALRHKEHERHDVCYGLCTQICNKSNHIFGALRV